MNTHTERTTMDNKDIIRKQMHDLLDMAIDTNGFESRKRYETGTLPTVFFNFSGHVNNLDIDLHTDGWVPGISSDRKWTFYLEKPMSEELFTDIQTAMQDALCNSTRAEVLRRDIAKAEEDLADRKASLARLKKALKKEEKGEKDV